MFKYILVPLDGSSLAERALPIAAHIARNCKGTLLLVRAVQPYNALETYTMEPSGRLHEYLEQDKDKATDYLTSVAAKASIQEGVNIQTVAVNGLPADAIIEVAKVRECDLIVMSSHGESGLKRWLVGSIAQRVVRHSLVPVLVVNEAATQLLTDQQGAPCAWVALDGTPEAEAILLPAAQLCSVLATGQQGILHLVRLITPAPYTKYSGVSVAEEMTQDEIREARDYLHSVEQRLLEGEFAKFDLAITSSIGSTFHIAHALVKIVGMEAGATTAEKARGYDILALATHGRSGLPRWIIGSVTESVLGTTKMPLLTVHITKQHSVAQPEKALASSNSA